jgi:hypothetical protein
MSFILYIKVAQYSLFVEWIIHDLDPYFWKIILLV